MGQPGTPTPFPPGSGQKNPIPLGGGTPTPKGTPTVQASPSPPPTTVGKCKPYRMAAGGTPIYQLASDTLLFLKRAPWATDFQRGLDIYAKQYRAQRKKWWGANAEHSFPYEGMSGKPFTMSTGGWVDLNPKASICGKGACAEWQKAICAVLPENAYRDDGCFVNCTSSPGTHISAYRYLYFAPKDQNKSNPLYVDREKYVVMHAPWITGCCCIYSLAAWEIEIGFKSEKRPGLW